MFLLGPPLIYASTALLSDFCGKLLIRARLEHPDAFRSGSACHPRDGTGTSPALFSASAAGGLPPIPRGTASNPMQELQHFPLWTTALFTAGTTLRHELARPYFLVRKPSDVRESRSAVVWDEL